MKKIILLLCVLSCLLIIDGFVFGFLSFADDFPVENPEEIESIPEIIEEEDYYDDMIFLAQLIEAEAGDQDLTGMRLVADVVLNRRDSEEFPNTIRDVVYQKKQFSCLYDGNFKRAGWNISDNAFKAAEMEMTGERLDYGIIYFSTRRVNGKNHWKHMDHWFSY